jgi:hypothetical protein
MMIVIAVFANVMLGYGSSRTQATLFALLPFIVAFSFFLNVDIDSPWQGIIHIEPQNLQTHSRSLHASEALVPPGETSGKPFSRKLSVNGFPKASESK